VCDLREEEKRRRAGLQDGNWKWMWGWNGKYGDGGIIIVVRKRRKREQEAEADSLTHSLTHTGIIVHCPFMSMCSCEFLSVVVKKNSR